MSGVFGGVGLYGPSTEKSQTLWSLEGQKVVALFDDDSENPDVEFLSQNSDYLWGKTQSGEFFNVSN